MADKFSQALKELEIAYKLRERANNEFVIYAGIAKCFEMALEYAWRKLKLRLESEGLEAYSPKEIVKAAGKAGLIDDVESWIECINSRNIAVHDYLGVTMEEYFDLIKRFIPLARRLEKLG
jgi:nucleotidyltransferase substrate binding protein (TIGR01987 family)